MTMKCDRSADEISGKLDKALNNPKKKEKKPSWNLGY